MQVRENGGTAGPKTSGRQPQLLAEGGPVSVRQPTGLRLAHHLSNAIYPLTYRRMWDQ